MGDSPSVKALAHGLGQGLRCEGFGEELDAEAGRGSLLGLMRIVAADEDDFELWTARPQLFGQAPTAHAAGHHDIGDDQVERAGMFIPLLERGHARRGLGDLVAQSSQDEADEVAQRTLVFDDEEVAHFAFIRGNSSVKVAPLPSPVLSANTRPPCALAIERTM